MKNINETDARKFLEKGKVVCLDEDFVPYNKALSAIAIAEENVKRNHEELGITIGYDQAIIRIQENARAEEREKWQKFSESKGACLRCKTKPPIVKVYRWCKSCVEIMTLQAKTEASREMLEDFMREIEMAQQGYKDQVWSGEECLSMLWCDCKIKLNKFPKTKAPRRK